MLIRDKIASGELFYPDSRVVLAVSGGIDSMVMTELFLHMPAEILVAHCNFRLRGMESDADEAFVREYCQTNTIPFISKSFDTSGFARENKISVQMAARELRYNWFDEIRLEEGFDFVATAHNLNDQIETFFINLSRGTGIRGLTGISSGNSFLIRPMSEFSRNEIEEYANAQGISWREDSSNKSEKYLRNKIRHKILPVMEELNPSFGKTMMENIQNLSRVQAVYLSHIEERKDYILRRTGNQYKISIQNLLEEKFGQSVLYEILTDLNFSSASVNDVWKSLGSSPGKKFYSRTHRIIKDRDELIIEGIKQFDDKKYYVDKDQKQIKEPVALVFDTFQNENFLIPPYPDVACLDAAKLIFPLIVRKWHAGDFFRPLGMENSKKLSDFFVDNKFSIPQKENTWLLCSGQDIVWVIGYRIDNRYKITGETRNIFQIKISD